MGKKHRNTFDSDTSAAKKRDRNYTTVVTQRLDETLQHVVETVHIDVAKLFAVDDENLSTELDDSSSVLAWLSQLKQHALVMMKRARYREHSLREDMYTKVKAKNARMSETAIKTLIYQTTKMRKRVEKYMLWAARYNQLDELHKAWLVRNDNLRTVESSKRKDRE